MEFKEDVLAKLLPKSREVWYVDINKLLLHGDPKHKKPLKPVIIVATKECLKHGCRLINIIPLTSQGQPDKFRFPVPKKCYEDIENDFNPRTFSLSLIQLYQPLDFKFFSKKCGLLDLDSYQQIKEALCKYVIGYTEHDFSP